MTQYTKYQRNTGTASAHEIPKYTARRSLRNGGWVWSRVAAFFARAPLGGRASRMCSGAAGPNVSGAMGRPADNGVQAVGDTAWLWFCKCRAVI